MRTPSWLPVLLVVPAGLFGCSSIGGSRNAPSDVKTVASIGDRPLPVRSGDPESSVRSGVPEPVITSSSGRISGRVYDEQGRPVSDARVRVAVGSERGGKALVATTDPSGAFTLRGLRPGSSYTLIAEYQGKSGPMTGRAEAEAPESNVRIGLQSRAAPRDESRTSIRPARPNVAQASSLDEVEESEEAEDASRFNREDIDPPAPEADLLGGEEPEEARPSTASGSARWTQRPGSVSRGKGIGNPDTSSRRPAADPASGDEDEENPLPPAIEPGRVGSTGEPDRDGDDSPALARGPAGGRSPQPLPDGVIDGARTIQPGSYGPIQMDEPQTAAKNPGDLPIPRPVTSSPSARPRRPAPATAPARSRPTWGELSFLKPSVPLDESLQKTSRDVSARMKSSPAAPSAPASAPAPASTLLAAGGPACRFDPGERKLDDFVLPDVQGRLRSFREFDADLVLLDFWGTWCAPCRKSVGHLVEIQKKLGGKKMQVVGIACERVAAKDRAAKVTQAVQQLGINYPVLVTTMDGTCPVQEAFQIQFYPTLVLLDRQGRILWREQGATDVTLARMDRFIARNLNLGVRRDTEPPPAQMARPSD